MTFTPGIPNNKTAATVHVGRKGKPWLSSRKAVTQPPASANTAAINKMTHSRTPSRQIARFRSFRVPSYEPALNRRAPGQP